MPQRTISTEAAQAVLEAVKSFLDRLGRHRLEMTQARGEASRELTTAYGELRQARDHLRRRAEGVFGSEVEIELSPREADLVACALLHEIEALSRRIGVGRGPSREPLIERRAQCMKLCVEFANQPVVRLIPTLETDHLQRCSEVLQVSAAIRRKLDPTQAERGLLDLDDTKKEKGEGRAPRSDIAASDLFRLQPHHLVHARLRSLINLEVAALRRATEAGDFRTATLHLAAIYETVLLDRALSRRDQLGLRKDPETWSYRELARLLLGRKLDDAERALAGYLESAHDLLRPAVQLGRPIVANRKSFERCMSFVESVFVGIGVVLDMGAASADASPGRAGASADGRSGADVEIDDLEFDEPPTVGDAPDAGERRVGASPGPLSPEGAVERRRATHGSVSGSGTHRPVLPKRPGGHHDEAPWRR